MFSQWYVLSYVCSAPDVLSMNFHSTVGRGVKGRWGVKGHLQNDSYQDMYMYHNNVVYYLEKYDI